MAYTAKITSRGCSAPLQRVITDFGADVPYAQVMDKLVEHYGLVLPESTITRITQHHAHRVFDWQEPHKDWPKQTGREVVIAEMDGGMVPIVQTDENQADRRKGKDLCWKEAKLCLAHAQGSVTLHYGGVLQGGVQEAGKQMFSCAIEAGFGGQTYLHAVGDGATWIADQVEEQFGRNGHYLVDFYHVCEYLGAAGRAIVAAPQLEDWMETQKERLKNNQAEQVIETLRPYLEPEEQGDPAAPVRCCHRYLSQRLPQLAYQKALDRDLPIGSGEIESAHRYVVQQRLKRPGSWWRIDHAEHMLALRLLRANRKWSSYWQHNRNKIAA